MRDLRRVAAAFALAGALAGPLAAADEPVVADAPVLNRKEVTLKSRSDADVQSKELWYARFDGKAWGVFQKHGVPFGRDNPVVWPQVPEGRWRTHIRYTEITGAAMPEPGPDAKPVTEFVIDRTPPTSGLVFPAARAKLRGGQKYVVRWQASDPNLVANPVSLLWSRGGDGKFEVVADKLLNNGSYEWTVPKDMTQNGTLQVQVIDKAGNTGTADSAAILVDAIAPRAQITGPAVTASADVALAITAADAGPAGLSSVQLLVSRDEGQTWNDGPRIDDGFTAMPFKAPGDGRYRLALVATDQAGNASAHPKDGGAAQWVLLVDSQAPVIQLSAAAGVTDTEGTAKPGYKAGDRVQVQFLVKDAYLAGPTGAVYLQTDPAKGWVELGKDLPLDQAFRFTIPAGSDTRAARIKVTAVDAAGNRGEALAQNTFLIKSTVDAGPAGPDGLDLGPGPGK